MFIGLDLGTSGVRALLVDDAGRACHSTEAPVPMAHPHPGWSEQNPADWITAATTALTLLAKEAPDQVGRVRGLGLSGHMHGATVLDAADRPLRPCIMWNDTRSHAQAARLDADPAFRAISGNIVFPGFTAPKLVWMADDEPGLFDQVATVMLPKDYLALWLTGRRVTDMSDAAGTSWLDVGKRDWSDDLLAKTGLNRAQMPDLVEGNAVIGTLRDRLATDLGLPQGIAVVAGGADNAAAACGAGALRDGDGFVSLGTSGVLLAARDGFAPKPESAVHTFCHAIPGTWYQMGVILAATDCLNWLSRITGATPAELTAELSETLVAPGSVRFLPYLSGERTPHNDSAVRGAFQNLDIATDRADLTRAVLEGVSFALRDNLDALTSTGARLDRLLAIGGGARSRYWVKLLATVLNLPLDLPEQGDFGAALGAARLAMSGTDQVDPTQIMTRPPVAETILPDADLANAFATAHADFAATYPLLKATP